MNKIKTYLYKIRQSRIVRGIILIVLIYLFLSEVVLRLIGAILFQPIEMEFRRLETAEAGVFRILCIGDSHTYGIDAPAKYSYPQQLANLLNSNRRAAKYLVVNAGVPGWNSSQSLIELKKVLARGKHPPQLVLICVGKNNDHNFQEARIWKDEHMKTQPVRTQIQYLLEHLKTYRLGKVTYYNIKALLAVHGDLNTQRIIWDDEILIDWLKQDYREMVDLAQSYGGQAVFINYWERWPTVDEGMKAVAAEKGVLFVDVTHFRLSPVLIWKLIGRTAHPNAKGYAAITRFIYDALLANRLVPDAPGFTARPESPGTSPQNP